MSKQASNSRTNSRQLTLFYKESRKAFGEQYRATRKPSVLIAQNAIEDAVAKGTISASEATAFFRSPTDFAALLMEAETNYQNSEDQKIHERMFKLEHNTDWKAAAAVSLGAGMVTGLAFAVAGPFFSSWLQPTADELFKRGPATVATAVAQPQPITNVTNTTNNYYSAPESSVQSSKLRQQPICKNMSKDAYHASLKERLEQGDTVTLELNGKKVSVCYRPTPQSAIHPQALANK